MSRDADDMIDHSPAGTAWQVRLADESLKRQDAGNRLKALDLSQSFIVQAPAGAGKTELLTQRYLGLLTTVETPEQIVAITFTRKAAAEMRNRILRRLELAAEPEPTIGHERQTWKLATAAMHADRKHGWGLLKSPDRLRITTIDSLCASLVRQMPYLSHFGGTPSVAEKPAIHYEEAAKQTVEAVEGVAAVARALAYLDNDVGKLQKLLVAMLSFRDQWLPHVGDLRTGDDAALRARLRADLSASLQRLVERDLCDAAQWLADIQSPELMAAARYVADFAAPDSPRVHLRDWAEPLTRSSEDLKRWQALARLLLTAKGSGTPIKAFGKNVGFPEAKEAPDAQLFKAHKAALKAASDYLQTNEKATAVLRGLTLCPAPLYEASDLEAIETFVDVLINAYGRLWGVFQEAGETDFVQVADHALRALGDAEALSDLALQLDYELRHLLVDEFQDTNDHQIKLLEKLTAGWTPQDARTLFVVGDPMQSIYRFRKADVGLFLRAWTRGIGGISLQPLTLYRNNRSLPKVVEWINGTFKNIFPELADPERGMVPYSHAIFTKSDPQVGVESGIFVHPIIVGVRKSADGDAEREVNARNHLGHSADDDVVEEETDQPEDGDELEARAILDIVEAEWSVDSTRNIAVLIRARNHLTPLVTEIRRSHPTLRYEAVEIESLSARQPIQDLLALTRALCHRGDRVNWLAILRAPWCGLTLADLFQLAKPESVDEDGLPRRSTLPTIWSLMRDQTRIAAISRDGQIRLQHACAALRDVIEKPGRQSLRRQVEGVWLCLGGNLCIGSESDVEDVNAFFRLLDKLDASGRFDLDRLEAEIRDLFAAPSTDKNAGKLKFMTVHKSKGLEFDTVILPGLHRKTGRNGEKLLVWEGTHDDEGNKHLVVAPYKRPEEESCTGEESVEEFAASNSEAIRIYINALEKTRVDQENRRVLYVATTRAIRSLHLLGIAKASLSKKTGQYELAEKSATTKGTPLRILWPAVSECYNLAIKKKLEDLALQNTECLDQPRLELSKFVPQLQRLRLDQLPSPVVSEVKPLIAEEITASEPVYLSGSNLAPNIGTLVHRYLELIAGQGVKWWDQARVRSLRATCEKWLHQQGHDYQECLQGAQRVEVALTYAVTDPTGRWILKSRADDGASELALTHLDQGALRNSIVDRTFVEDGVRWIVDYKTASHEGDDIESFIRSKCDGYAEQLERYASLFQQDKLPIKKAIYFVDLNRFEILP